MQEAYRRSAMALMGKALRQLPDREAYVLTCVYGLETGIPMTQREVTHGSSVT